MISKALIGKQINIEVRGKQGKNIGLSAAAKAGSLEVSAGASASADVEQETIGKDHLPNGRQFIENRFQRQSTSPGP